MKLYAFTKSMKNLTKKGNSRLNHNMVEAFGIDKNEEKNTHTYLKNSYLELNLKVYFEPKFQFSFLLISLLELKFN